MFSANSVRMTETETETETRSVRECWMGGWMSLMSSEEGDPGWYRQPLNLL